MHNRWCKKADDYLFECRISELPLSGITVRVRRSDSEPLCGIGCALESAFKKYGANITIIEDLDADLTCQHGLERLAGIDAFIMLAASIGVSAEALELAHFEKGKVGVPKLNDRLYVAMPKEFGDGFIRKRLDAHNVNLKLYKDSDLSEGGVFLWAMNKIIDKKRLQDSMLVQKLNDFKPKIGIVTALQIEYDAVVALLNKPCDQRFSPTPNSLHEYTHGTLPSYNQKEHAVVVVRSGVGNNNASIKAQQLIADFELDIILMVGIAGGIPKIEERDPDIRLGDVVVSGRMGVIQYDMVKDTSRGQEPNHPPRPPSAAWLDRATSFIGRDIEMDAYKKRLEIQTTDTRYARPLSETDQLFDDSDPNNPIKIERPSRQQPGPLAFEGAVGSANRVVKCHQVREELRARHNLLAVEMEASGVADAAMANGTSFFVIRGICDYANDGKNKKWQPYAAMSAAVFAASLIESMPLTESR